MIVLGCILDLLGVLLILAFAVSRIKCTTAVAAVVSHIDIKKMTVRGSTVKRYLPTFTYTVNGKEYTAKADSDTADARKFIVGQTVTIYTDINNPTVIRYGSNSGFLTAGIILTAVGIGIIVLSFL